MGRRIDCVSIITYEFSKMLFTFLKQKKEMLNKNVILKNNPFTDDKAAILDKFESCQLGRFLSDVMFSIQMLLDPTNCKFCQKRGGRDANITNSHPL